MNFFGFAIFVCLLHLVRFSFACNGQAVKVKSITNYKDNNLNLENDVQLNLTPDCLLHMKLCFSIANPIESGLLSYELKKGFTVASASKEDVCSTFFDFLNIPCPLIENDRYCSNITDPIDVSNISGILPWVKGDATITGAKIEYPNKKTDTFDITINIFAKK